MGKEFIDGTTVLATDLVVTAAVFDTEPAPGDVLAIDGVAVTIIKQMRIPAAGVADYRERNAPNRAGG